MSDLILPPGKFGAYLFDLDGTVADTMGLHHQVWREVLKDWNCPFEREIFYGWAGRPIRQIIELLNQRYGLKMPVEELIRRKNILFEEVIHEVKPITSVVKHVHEQRGKIPLAIVSGSTRESIRKTLKAIDLEHDFEIWIGAEDYQNAKPHPEPFLTAAQKLGVAPQSCLVFEDADLGIQAAEAAGMKWVRVPITLI